MRTILTAMLLLAVPGAVLADVASHEGEMPRIDIHDMVCVDVQAAVRSSGTALLRRPSTHVEGMMLYDRYVVGGSVCRMQDIAVRAAVPTSDAKSPHACRVMQCKDPARSMAR